MTRRIDAPAALVRRARPEDAETLTRIAHAAKRHWGYPEEWIAAWRADLSVHAGACAEGTIFCACGGDGEQIVGFYALERDGAVVSLEHMWVDPPHMGRGTGARLFRHALEEARRLGGRTLEIASDPNAAGFYRRMGAHQVGEVASSPAGRSLPLLVVDLELEGDPPRPRLSSR